MYLHKLLVVKFEEKAPGKVGECIYIRHLKMQELLEP